MFQSCLPSAVQRWSDSSLLFSAGSSTIPLFSPCYIYLVKGITTRLQTLSPDVYLKKLRMEKQHAGSRWKGERERWQILKLASIPNTEEDCHVETLAI